MFKLTNRRLCTLIIGMLWLHAMPAGADETAPAFNEPQQEEVAFFAQHSIDFSLDEEAATLKSLIEVEVLLDLRDRLLDSAPRS